MLGIVAMSLLVMVGVAALLILVAVIAAWALAA
jgi:hypothetical protein